MNEYVKLVRESLPEFDVEGALYYTSASTSELVPAGQDFGNVVGEIFKPGHQRR